MNITKGIKSTLIFSMIFFTGSVLAYSSISTPNKHCKDPRFRSFSPERRAKKAPVPEVEAESSISFTVSRNTDPTTINIMIKNKTIKANVIDRNSFFQVSAQLPAELNGQFARIHLKAKSRGEGGTCIGKDGWLIKIKEPVEVVKSVPVTAETVSE